MQTLHLKDNYLGIIEWRKLFVDSKINLQQIGEGYKITGNNPDGKQSVSYIDADGANIVSGIFVNGVLEYSFAFYDDAGNLIHN